MFKENFKYYKSKKPTPDLGRILNFNSLDAARINVRKIPVNSGDKPIFFGFQPLETWDVYEITNKPGLLFIKNPFTSLGQRYWTVRCLKDYSRKPNKSNIDPENLVPDNKDWWEMCKVNNKLLLNKMRWITLGYHHNWDTKVYSENNRGEFPKDLGDMTAFIARVLGYSNFSAEAAIINYYHMDSTLSGHTDHSERNLEAPLFSFSFGQTAIFLIGGKSIDDCTLPIFLHSGDIIVMSKESRLCFHGVPKILSADSRSWLNLDNGSNQEVPMGYKDVVDICISDTLWKPFDDYLSHSRINMNVRQVLYEGEELLD